MHGRVVSVFAAVLVVVGLACGPSAFARSGVGHDGGDEGPSSTDIVEVRVQHDPVAGLIAAQVDLDEIFYDTHLWPAPYGDTISLIFGTSWDGQRCSSPGSRGRDWVGREVAASIEFDVGTWQQTATAPGEIARTYHGGTLLVSVQSPALTGLDLRCASAMAYYHDKGGSDIRDDSADFPLDGDVVPVALPPAPVCNDGIDNDRDGVADGADPACAFPRNATERLHTTRNIRDDISAFYFARAVRRRFHTSTKDAACARERRGNISCEATWTTPRRHFHATGAIAYQRHGERLDWYYAWRVTAVNEQCRSPLTRRCIGRWNVPATHGRGKHGGRVVLRRDGTPSTLR
jgi:hypothetical protein